MTDYPLSTDFVHGPHRLYQQVNRNEPMGLYLPVGTNHTFSAGHILRLEGMGRLTVPTSETMAVEVDETRAELLVAKAAVHLFTTLANTDPGSRADHLMDAATWQAKYNGLLDRGGIRMWPLSAHNRYLWSASLETHTLTLRRGRG